MMYNHFPFYTHLQLEHMYQPVALYIGLRYMHRQSADYFSRFVSWLSTIGITLGVMSLVTVLSVMNGFEKELENNILKLIPQAILTSPNGYIDPKHIPESLPKMFSEVIHVAPLTTSDVILQSASGLAIGVMLGINPNDPEPLFHYLIDTNQEDLIAGQYQVILGDELATRLNVKRGDVVRLIVPSVNQLTLMGRIPSQRLFTVIGTFSSNSEVDSYQLLINQHDASRLMHYLIGYITGWRLWLQDPLMVDTLSSQLLPKGLVWHDWRERKGELFQAVKMEKNMMSLLLSLIITVAIFNIMTSLGLLVMEKKVEVAILKTQGLTRNKIMLVFITQGASTGIIGALLGAILGGILANQLNRLIPIIGLFLDSAALPVSIKPFQIIIITLTTISISLLSTVYPSWRAAIVRPSEALRYE